ncbi:MAG: hypothetical protein GX605_12480 [Chloroflexi bacterium]|nr:hypothetical protein [Chloroflexota bacterium]
MELKRYWEIVWRRWWLPVGLATLVGLLGLLWPSSAPTTLQASMRFTVGLAPEPKTGDYYAYDGYYTWLTSEYIVDDFSEMVRSAAFAEAVSRRLGNEGIAVPPGAISGSTVADKLHRILKVRIVWPDEGQLRAIARAAAEELQANNAWYFAQLGAQGATVQLIDPPSVSPVGPSLRQRLDLPIRLLLALFVGLSLAFLLDYLDDTVRGRRELEALGLSVLGEIPGRGRALFSRRR